VGDGAGLVVDVRDSSAAVDEVTEGSAGGGGVDVVSAVGVVVVLEDEVCVLGSEDGDDEHVADDVGLAGSVVVEDVGEDVVVVVGLVVGSVVVVLEAVEVVGEAVEVVGLGAALVCVTLAVTVGLAVGVVVGVVEGAALWSTAGTTGPMRPAPDTRAMDAPPGPTRLIRASTVAR
jgi:hypothetical protein